jgi:hypothetical protein
MPTLSPSFPPVDAAIAAARRINWQQVAHRALMVLATVAAVTVAITLWAIRTGRQFWANHGTTITAAAKTAATRTAAAAAATWQVASPVLARTANRAADATFRWLADGRPITLPFPGPAMAL